MSDDLICEKIAHQAGFMVSVGNWISPDGRLILGEDYDEHHRETLIKYLHEEPEDNALAWMNKKVEEGYIRLVFRADTMFHVGCQSVNDIWNQQPNHQSMLKVLSRLRNMEEIDIHIFSKHFYVIGKAKDIVDKNMTQLQVRTS